MAQIGAAIELDPHNSLAYSNLGNAMQSLGMDEQSIACYDCAVGIDPLMADAFFNRGVVQQKMTRLEDSLGSYAQAIAVQPQHAHAMHRKGMVLHAMDRNEEAVASYDAAININADDANVFFNRGVALQCLNRNESAVQSYDAAIALQPDHASAWNNQGNSYQSLDLFQSALTSYRVAQSLDDSYGDPHLNEALCLLKTGDFELGWKKYEWRLARTVSHPVAHAYSGALWHGEDDLHGRSILLHAEQGLGDTIQFCRYAALVAQRGAQVILQVPQSLNQLLSKLEGVAAIVSDERPTQHDFHCPLMSLPLAFGTRLSNIPSAGSYLYGDPHSRCERLFVSV